MNLFKKVSILVVIFAMLFHVFSLSGVSYAAEEGAGASASNSAANSDSPATVQSDTYSSDGSPDGSTIGENDTPDSSLPSAPAEPAAPVPSPADSSEPAVKQNILTRAYLTDANQNIIDAEQNPDLSIDPDAPVYLNYEWALPDDGSYRSGSTFEFDLPKAFQLYNDINNVPLQFEDGTVGSFSATRSGHVVMTFNRAVEEYSLIHGTMQFGTAFSQETITGSTEVKIPIPLGATSEFVLVYLKPEKGTTLGKRGEATSNSQIRWTIDMNTTKEKLDNAVLSDPITAGLKLNPDSIQVYALNVDVDGTTSLGEPVTSGYKLDSSDNRFEIAFDSSIRTAYRIIYTTDITDGTQTKFSNTAALASSKGNVTAKAEVQVKQQFLSKKAENYDPTTGTIDWTIGYNLNSQSIPQKSALLKDRFNSSQKLVQGSLHVYDNAGNLLVENKDYSYVLTPIQNSRTGFDLQFLINVTSPYTIKYQTTPVDEIIKKEVINNTVTAGGISAGDNQEIKGALFSKTLTNVNYIRKDTTWTLTANSDNQSLSNVVIEDKFPNGGLELQPSTLTVLREDKTPYPAANYKVTVDNVRSGFKIEFNTTVNEPLKISYRTTFDAEWKKNKAEVSYHNVANLYWIENGAQHVIPAEARFWPDNMTVSNGSKEGVYNPVTREITWTIKANYNKKTLTNAVLTDTIEPGQSYVEGSLGVYHMNLVGVWNSVTQGTAVDPAAYTSSTPAASDDGGSLQVKFANPINSPYWITFKTTLEGHVVPPTVRNSAVLKGNENSYPWAAVVSIPNGGEYVAKSGKQDGEKIDWKVEINRGQSYVENAKIVDTPTSNQILLTDSFRLYQAATANDGTLSKGALMTEGKDYSLTVSTGSADRFELAFLQPIDSAFILEYSSMITAPDRDEVSNSVQFSGDGIKTGTIETSKDIIVRTSSASGTGSGTVGNLIISKVDSADSSLPLAGAVFQLQDTAGLRPAITVTTDAQGRALFPRLLYGNYNLQEITAPEGYTLDQTIYPVTINSKTQESRNAMLMTIKNTKKPVTETPGTDNPGTDTPGGPGTDTPGTDNPDNPSTPTTPGGGGNPPGPTTPSTPGGGTTPPTGNTGEPVVPIGDEPIPAGTVEPDPEVPPAPESTNTPDVTVPDEPVPQGTVPPESTPDIPVGDEPVPRGTITDQGGTPNNQPTPPMLPQTGESSQLPFWLTGAGLIMLGILLNRIQQRHSKKNS